MAANRGVPTFIPGIRHARFVFAYATEKLFLNTHRRMFQQRSSNFDNVIEHAPAGLLLPT